MDDIEVDEDTYDSIVGLRSRLAKTYSCLLSGVETHWKGDKKYWMELIDN
jgi:hypothetical protein